MSEGARCPACGATVDAAAAGMKGACAACFLAAATIPPEAPDLAGSELGDYAIGRVLGQGGMGVVYEATDTRRISCRFGRTVALKILAGDFDATAQLVREAQLVAALEHENIVPVYDVGEDEGIAYFTMKLVDGGPPKAPAPSPRKAAEIVVQIARAVEFAHRHGILHRDLKPANVLVDKSGRVYVTDFGLAAREGLAPASSRRMGGTPTYMAPEVWRGAPGSATTAADIWGAGAILYELLTGRPAFEGATWDELARRITAEPPPPLTGVPADIAAVCLRCLEKDPARRYATAGELAADLERFLAGEPVQARPQGIGARWLRRVARHPWITALAVLLVVVASHAAITAISLARAKQAAFRAADVTARSLARLTALQFERYKAAVENAGRDPRIARALGAKGTAQPSAECERLLGEPLTPSARPFTTWFLLDESGTLVGRAPPVGGATIGQTFTFRDYFRGAEENEKQGRRAAYVSRAHKSEGDGDYEIAISFAVHDQAERWVGLLVATFPTGSAMGSIELEETGDIRFQSALLAPRGLERGEAAPNPQPIYILHHALSRGEGMPAPVEDLLGGDLSESAFVRLVPVRGTPFSVLVRVAFDDPVAGQP